MPKDFSSSGRLVCHFGNYELDRTSLELRKSGRKLKLAPQPARVLGVLAGRSGELVTREEIRREIWGDETFVDFERGLNYCLNCIRSALGDNAQTPRFIETLPRRGYRFIGNVLQATATAEQSLAVLPFENLSHDPEQEFLADSMADALITELGKGASLRVISRQSSLHFKNSPASLPDIARRLRVGLIVEGTVLKVGDRLRITAQLIKTKPEQHLWADSYECDLSDLLDVQKRIAKSIAAQIHARLGLQGEASRAYSVNPEAHLHYSKGRYHAAQLTFPGYENALVCFRRAIAIDPGYAPAYANLADTYNSLGFWGYIPEAQAYLRARDAALEANTLDDHLSVAHFALGWVRWVYDWDIVGGESEFRRAIELDPNDPVAYVMLSLMMAVVHRSENEALEKSRIAVGLDPMSLSAHTNAACIPLHLGKYDLAVQQAQKVLELFPRALQGWYVLGQSELARGHFAEAARLFEKALEISRDSITMSYVGHAYARAGQRSEAEKCLQVLQARSRDEYVIPRSLLWIHIGLGDTDRAFEILKQEFEKRSSFLWWLRSGVSLFDPIRSDSRYSDLVRRMGFPSIEKLTA